MKTTSLKKTTILALCLVTSILFLGSLIAGDGPISVASAEEFSITGIPDTGLPVLYIDTEDALPITNKTDYVKGNLKAISGSAGEGIPREILYDGGLSIKGRGNTSWNYPKKPYRLKLDKKADLFGLGSNKHWVLISNYIDVCNLRNKTAYDLARELGLDSMDCTWVDVVLNGDYLGNYLLCEQIRIDKNRINIFDWEGEAEDQAKAIVKAEKKKGNDLDQDALEDQMKTDLSWVTSGIVVFEGQTYTTSTQYEDLSGGYLFEMSIEYDEFSKFTTESGLNVMIKSPEYLSTNPDMLEQVTDFWNDLERAYRSENGYVTTKEGRKHYSEMADLDSMVSYWLLMEIMGNYDAQKKSRYAYLDRGELLRYGPAWDYDWSSASYVLAPYEPNWAISKYGFYQNFFLDFTDDPVFLTRATEIYWEIRPYLEELIRTGGILDSEVEYLSAAGAADDLRWSPRSTSYAVGRDFGVDTDMFLSYLRTRIEWMDTQFSSDQKLLDSLYTTQSTSPYVKDSRLTLSIPNSIPDVISTHAPADGITTSEKDPEVRIGVSDPKAKYVEVYVNGLYRNTYAVSKNTVSVKIPFSALSAVPGRKNVISVIGKNASGATTGRNYTTLIVSDENPAVRKEERTVLIGEAGVLEEGYQWINVDPTVVEVTGNTFRAINAGMTCLVGRGAEDSFLILLNIEYQDVSRGSDVYFADSVYWAVDRGITKGVHNPETGLFDAFRPGNTCTRAQMVTFLWRLAGCPKPSTGQAYPNPFYDLQKNTYYYEAVLWGAQNGIIEGYPDGSFQAQGNCTRSQAVTFLWRFAGRPEPTSTVSVFPDVKDPDTYYYKAVLWASEQNITFGYPDGTFQPGTICTRSQIITFLYRKSTGA